MKSRWGREIAESRRRAAWFLRSNNICKYCRKPIATRGREAHFLCDPESMVARPCSCPAGCTDTRWGNGPRECDPECVPCRRMHGQPYRSTLGRG